MATTKVTTDVIDMSGNAGGLTWVKGTTAQQPSGVIGEIREDTETNRTLVYTDETGTAKWINLKEEAISTSFTVDYLVIAGGGSGGVHQGGGGGAGGYRTSYGTVSPITLNGGTMESALSLSVGTVYVVTVGPGGAAVSGTGARANDGSNSAFSTIIISTGGGGGGTASLNVGNAYDGGSGGGGSGDRATTGGSAVTSPVIQGYAGGNGIEGASGNRSAGAGGGAADPGDAATLGNGGDGGIGLENEITGATGVFYAGGGGGSAQGNGGTGGSGVGGTGASNTTGTTSGSPNTGGGGGGNDGDTGGQNSGAGGSGIVILRCTKATATLGSGITVNSTAGPGSVNGVAISGTSDYYYSATAGTGTITFS